MTRKTPSDFTSHDDWLSYVRREIAVSDQPYALAFGRVELFRSFYGMQGHEFPAPFATEFERIDEMHGPERTAALETLNKSILANLTQLLADQSRPSLSASDPLARRSSRETDSSTAQPSCAEESILRAVDCLQEWREGAN